MLLRRSTQFLILLIISLAHCKVDKNTKKAEKLARPDYSEFYKSPVATAIKNIKSGRGSKEAASEASEVIYKHIEKDPFGIEKYIDDDSYESEEEAYETKPGPYYATYTVPVSELKKHKRENEYEEAIAALDKEYSVPITYKLKDDVVNENPDGSENIKPATTNSFGNYDQAGVTSYDGGVNSEIKTPQFYIKHTETPIETVGPYEKHSDNKFTKSNSKTSFNPSYSKFVKSDVPNYDYQPSENIKSSQKSSNCKKIVKQGAGKDIPMTCTVCKDPETGAKSEQCSYTSAPEPKSFYSAKNEKFSQPHKAENIRYRRYAPKKEEFADPYDYVKETSQKYFSKPKEFESEYYKPKDFYEEYKFPEDYFAGESNAKSESEVQSEKLMKDGGTCKEVTKNGMKCKICKNEKTGGNYEQCSYTSAPSEKKYAYVSERKFDGDGNPIEDKDGEGTEAKESVSKNEERKPPQSKSVEARSKSKSASQDRIRNNRRAKLVEDNPYDIPKHFVEDTLSTQKSRSRGLDPELYGSADSSYESRQQKYVPDEYQGKVFPKSSKQTDQKNFDSEDKKDVEKVLEEFAKKDRSSCKKAQKNGMTCYLCVNKEGTQHEECMYVAANTPQVSHVAYHEVEEFKNKGKPQEMAASTVKETEANPPGKRKRFFKKVTVVPSNIQTASSDLAPSTTRYVGSEGGKFRAPRKLRRNRNFSGSDAIFAESKTREVKVKPDSKEPNLPTPQEFVVGEAEGAFSSETKPVYSKDFGVILPKYMIEKSIFEKNFDEFSSQS